MSTQTSPHAAHDFPSLGLIAPLLRAVAAEGYETPTPIQLQAIPHVLAGRDLLGCAQTGTGKTAAFALPILQRMTQQPARGRPGLPRVLVLSPTRELAAQIGESFIAYGKNLSFSTSVIFGGVGQDAQVKALRRGIDVLVATPGRLLDLMGQGQVTLSSLEVFVLDEADRMLDMGFVHDVKRIIAVLPKQRQSLFFSATMPSEIRSLASTILTTPVEVAVTPVSSTAEKIAQNLYFVEKHDKRALLLHLLQDRSIARALVFTRTKHGANRVAESLEKARVASAAIHGNKSQGARERALSGFKTGALRVLVATDIAARGIDVEGVTHVFNFDLPNIPESYVHRIGRTARAGAEGIAISFCEQEERPFLVDIERLIQMNIPRVDDHPFRSSMSAPQPTDLQPRAGRRGPVTAPPPRSQASQGQRPRAQGGHGAHERPRPSQSQSQSQSQGHGPSHANPSSQAHAPSQANAPRPARSTPNAPTNAPTHTAETVHSGRLERRKRSWV